MTEKELIEGCKKKDPKSQRMLFDQFSGRMMTICRRYSRDQKEAEDMLQEAFIRVFLYIHQYKFDGPLGAWIRRVTVNSSLSILQSKKIQFSEMRGDQPADHAVDSDALSNLNEEELLKLIGNLPDGYRVIFNLYAIEGYNHDEIAEMLKIKPATSRSQLSKARRILQEQITSLFKTVR